MKWLGCGVWAGSWYLMYLEVTRWHHVKPSLAFNPPPVREDETQPRPGLPLKLLYVACVVSPLAVLATSIMQKSGRRADGR